MRAGYKQTEVGVIPKDWNVKTIDQIALVTSGKRLPLGSYLVDHSTSHPYIRVTDMRPGTVALADIRYVPENVFPAIKRYRIYRDDIFISVAGTLGIVGKVPSELDGANLTENADRITNISCSQDFLLYVLMSSLIQNKIESIQTVGAQPKLALARIRKFDVPLPPTETEQRAIATALSDMDALLEGLTRLIAKKRDLKQAAMQQLLTGQTRLPGFHREWEVKRLGSVLKFQVGCPFSSVYFNEKEQGVRLVKNRDLKSDDQVFHYSGKYDSAFEVQNGDVLVGMDGDFLPCRWAKGAAVLNQRVGRILPSERLDKTFAFYYLINLLKEIEISTACTTVKHLSHGDIEGIEKPLPSVAEQSAISSVLSEMDVELTTLKARRDKTWALKKAMMQDLLTGKTRLN